jgi:hypothetical protein
MPTVPSLRAPSGQALWQAQLLANKKYLIGGAVALLALLVWLIVPKGDGEGDLVINVSGPAGVAVDGIRVFVDGDLTCEDSPCSLKDVAAKGHVITVEAPGYNRSAPVAVLVKRGETALHSVELARAKGTGLAIPESPGDVTVTLDGKALGRPPLKLDDIAAGEHTLQFSGGERLAAEERRIQIQPGEVFTLAPVKLRVLRGRVKLVPGPNMRGAQVSLDGRSISLPYEAELDATQPHRVQISKEGFTTFGTDVTFEAGEPTRQLTLELQRDNSEKPEAEEVQAATQDQFASASEAPRAASGGKAKAASAPSSPKPAAGGNAKLTLLSVPEAVVILDGRPIGKTPKKAVSVPAGNHSIVFVHPTKGRKRASAKLAGGASKTIAVKF